VRKTRLFLVLYLLSGAASLIYEVVWLRLLTLSMGHTASAVGTVLAAFMGGLAAGAWIGGRVTSGIDARRALRMYAGLEIAVAVCALLLPFALGALRPLLAFTYANGTDGLAFDAMRVAVSILLIAIPTLAMGASYPIGIVAIEDPGAGIRDPEDLSQGAGALYAANTVGATLGAVLSGFVLLPSLGMSGTTLVAAALNAIAAAGAVALSSRTSAPSHPAPSHLAPSHLAPSHLAPSHLAPSNVSPLAVPALALALSGFAALVFEVTWTRILAMILGPTTYAFSAMLVAFIAGLAIGSTAAAALIAHRRTSAPPHLRTPAPPHLRTPAPPHPRTNSYGAWLGVAMIVTAAAALLAASRVDRLPLMIAATAGKPDVNFSAMFALEVALTIAMLLPMTIALGTTFPLALAMTSASAAEMPAAASVVYAMNTAGAIGGALIASFVLVPHLGLQMSIQTMSIIVIVGGAAVAWRSMPRGAAKGALSAAAVGIAASAIVMPQWNHARIANGAYRLAPALAAGDVPTALEAGRLEYYKEGAAGTVSVRQLLGVRSLAIDGKVDASNRGDMLTQKLLAHLPLLLHPNPRSVYIIGLGSGVTLGAALRHPIDRAVVSEISPEVVSASDAFKTENHDALRDARTHLVIGDGRAHLLLSNDKYDVIISEPSNPWMAGVSTLFTEEFFRTARSHLAPGGILCQWAHTYNIADADLRSIIRTFLAAFPNGTAWLVGESDVLLIGSDSPLAALDDGIEKAWQRPGIAADLAEVQLREPFGAYTLYIGRGNELSRYAGGAVVQNDDRLALEFSAPRAIYGRFEQLNLNLLQKVPSGAQLPAAIARARSNGTALEWKHRGEMEAQADAPNFAYDSFVEALRRNPTDTGALDGLVHAAVTAGRLTDAEAFLRDLALRNERAPVLLELLTVVGSTGRTAEAAQLAQRAVALDPSSIDAQEQLVSVTADSGDKDALAQLAASLERSSPGSPATLYAEARLRYMLGQYAAAATVAAQLTGVQRDKAWAFELLGGAAANAGEVDRAREAFAAALRLSPRDISALINLGTLELKSGHPQAAADRFSEALFLYPRVAPALDGLAQALDQLGKKDRAAEVRELIPQ
jgi:spermidine synthase